MPRLVIIGPFRLELSIVIPRHWPIHVCCLLNSRNVLGLHVCRASTSSGLTRLTWMTLLQLRKARLVVALRPKQQKIASTMRKQFLGKGEKEVPTP